MRILHYIHLHLQVSIAELVLKDCLDVHINIYSAVLRGGV